MITHDLWDIWNFVSNYYLHTKWIITWLAFRNPVEHPGVFAETVVLELKGWFHIFGMCQGRFTHYIGDGEPSHLENRESENKWVYIYTLIRMVDGWWPSSMNAMGPGSWRISTEAKEALIAATPHEIAQLFQREVLFCFFTTGTKKGMATPRYQRFFAAFYHVFVFWPVKYQGNGLRTYLSLCLYIYLIYIDLI